MQRHKRWIDKLIRLHACSDAVSWCRTYDSLDDAWQSCTRGDWMLWLLGRLSGSGSKARKQLVLTTCECARLALSHVKTGEDRPLKAIETTERWAIGKATIQEVRAAADAAYAAAAYAAAAYAAADVAADVADAADTADVADAAAYAVDTAGVAATADIAATAAYDAARSNILKRCADIVRSHYPKAPEM